MLPPGASGSVYNQKTGNGLSVWQGHIGSTVFLIAPNLPPLQIIKWLKNYIAAMMPAEISADREIQNQAKIIRSS
jgi:hypothetical protein